MSANRGKQQRQINIQVPAELEATYANFSVISHTPSEVIIDFARMMPNTPTTRVYARVVLTPLNAKLLHNALGTNLEKYETQYGEIKTQDASIDEDGDLGFRH